MEKHKPYHANCRLELLWTYAHFLNNSSELRSLELRSKWARWRLCSKMTWVIIGSDNVASPAPYGPVTWTNYEVFPSEPQENKHHCKCNQMKLIFILGTKLKNVALKDLTFAVCSQMLNLMYVPYIILRRTDPCALHLQQLICGRVFVWNTISLAVIPRVPNILTSPATANYGNGFRGASHYILLWLYVNTLPARLSKPAI